MSKSESRAAVLHAAAARLLRHARKADGRAGSGPAQTSALGTLLEYGPMSLAALAAHEGVSHATVSRMISGLELSGCVRKKIDPDDRRRQIVALTPKGTRLYQEAHARRQRMIDHLVSLLKRETVDDLIVVLSRLADLTEAP